MSYLTVGQVAKRAGVNLQTIHYYERRDLLPAAARSDANYRLYRADAVQRTRFIKKAQRVGFTLEEVKELISLRAESVDQCRKVKALAEIKLEQIDEKLRSLRTMRSKLRGLVGRCDAAAASPGIDCPMISAFDSEEVE